MSGRRQDGNSGSAGPRAFVLPVAWIAVLLVCYWLAADWRTVPALLAQAVATLH
jgi:hypothetical protein